jgi:hypothetical protein
MDWLGYVADVIGILSALFALLAWLSSRRLRKEIEQEKARQNKRIRVVLRYGSESLELPVELRRKEFTRAEVLGRLGMIPMKDKGKRFSLNYLGDQEFLKQLNKIREGEGDSILIIPCNQEEFEQFAIQE